VSCGELRHVGHINFFFAPYLVFQVAASKNRFEYQKSKRGLTAFYSWKGQQIFIFFLIVKTSSGAKAASC
jgi:hypothetical protein